MDESLIRGLILGAVFAAAALTVVLIKKLFSSSEVARRLRLVIAWAFGTAVVLGFMLGTPRDRETFAVIAAIGAAIAALRWVLKGRA